MTKREVFELLKKISVFYDQFEINQQKVDEWYILLKDYSFETLEKNLLNYIASFPYAPKVSDLIRKPAHASRAIPNHEETHVLLMMQEKPASEEIVQRELAKMREILGIKSGES